MIILIDDCGFSPERFRRVKSQPDLGAVPLIPGPSHESVGLVVEKEKQVNNMAPGAISARPNGGGAYAVHS
jgi:hypothetical protein